MAYSLKEIILGYFFYNLNPMYLVYCILYFVNIKQYTICGDKELINRIIKKIKDNIYYTQIRHHNGKDSPCGLFFGKKYYGCIDTKENTIISIYTTQKNYNELMLEDIVVPEKIETEKDVDLIELKPNKKINIYIRKGSYKSFYYNTVKLDLSHINPIGQQIDIVSEISEIYNKKGRASIFIHGVTGAGKSTIGFLLAKKLNGMYCHTFNPTDPGDQLSNLISDMQEQDGPIIVVMEEIDVLLKEIHVGIVKNKEIPISVHNKSTWCSFIDDLIFYKILFIFTSNTSKKDIDKLDVAYLRKGRIDEYYSMDTPIIL